jgi:hypothetical protein
MLLRVTTLVISIATLCAADSLTLRSGRVVHGQYLGGDARQVRMAVGDRVDTFDVGEVSTLQFGGGERMSSEHSGPPPEPTYSNRDSDRRDSDRRDSVPLQPQSQAYGGAGQQQSTAGLQIPTGTAITVRMIDGVDSEQTRLGQTFRASLDEPVLVNGQTVVSRGADCVVRLVEDKQSGKFAGRTSLTLDLQQIMVNGRMIDVTSGDVTQAS